MIDKIKMIPYFIAACAIAFSAGYYAKKPKEIIQVEEKIVEKVVEKVVELEHKKQQKVTKIVEKPDGSKETTIVDNTTETNKKEKETDKSLNSDKKVLSEIDKAPAQSRFSASTYFNIKDLKRVYQAEVGYRIIGGLWGEVFYNLEHKNYGFGIRTEY